jgi:hypothetical protein
VQVPRLLPLPQRMQSSLVFGPVQSCCACRLLLCSACGWQDPLGSPPPPPPHWIRCGCRCPMYQSPTQSTRCCCLHLLLCDPWKPGAGPWKISVALMSAASGSKVCSTYKSIQHSLCHTYQGA